MKPLRILVLGAGLALAACTAQPIYNVTDSPLATPSGRHATAAQVRSAIITAGTSLGWRIVDAGPGRLEGTLNLRTHLAVVEIPYSATSFGIVYKRSENLDASGSTIHRNYNGWVQNLERQIRAEVSRL